MTKKLFALFSLTLITALAVVAPVGAARTTQRKTGNDISWPQCGRTLPTGQAFGIVGVNGGTAAKVNPCLAQQLAWAAKSNGLTSQPEVQLYVNTANPGEIIDEVTTWPTDNKDLNGVTTNNPYGLCDGTNTLACSWQYGWNRAIDAVQNMFIPAANSINAEADPAKYVWWLDVETMNTWQSGSPEALAKNAATLEGMTAHYQSRTAKVGLYSTGYQWGQIVGTNVGKTGNLKGLDSWLAGARTEKDATTNCKKAALTGGKVTLTQYVSGGFDYDVSCVQ